MLTSPLFAYRTSGASTPSTSARWPLRLRLGLLAQHVVQRTLLRLALVGHEDFEGGPAEVAGRADQVLQRLAGVALQADPKGRQDACVLLGQASGHLDLGESLLRPAKELLVVPQALPKGFLVGHEASLARLAPRLQDAGSCAAKAAGSRRNR